MPPLNLLIKPASGLCGMACRYCFYADLSRNGSAVSGTLMTEKTLELLVEKALASAEGACTLAFQGGEPTLRGLPFFQRLVELVAEKNRRHIPVQYAIQTNGQIIDEEWAAFFARNRFLVGLSVDGTRDIHDHWRPAADGSGTFSAVRRAARLLDEAKVAYNILTVVTAQLARHIQQVYAFYKRSGWYYQQYIPCLDPLGGVRGEQPYSLRPAAYADFLKTLFDLWYADILAGRPVSVRYFDNLLTMLQGRPPESCGMSGVCTCQNVIEADGSVYPCDFYVTEAYCLGNIRETDFDALQQGERAAAFVRNSASLPAACAGCQWLPLCRNGCRRDRDADGKNYYCEAYQEFFAYAFRRLQRLAACIRLGGG